MQIVIDIPEEEYRRMKEKSMFGRVDVWKDAIRNGIPLPKGHGDLKDARELLEHIDNMPSELTGDYRRMIRKVLLMEYIKDSLPTIIEADKEIDE